MNNYCRNCGEQITNENKKCTKCGVEIIEKRISINDNKATLLCGLSLFFMFFLPIASSFKLFEILGISIKHIDIYSLIFILISWVLMVFVKVKYPYNEFGKALMYIIISYTLYSFVFDLVIESAFNSIDDYITSGCSN